MADKNRKHRVTIRLSERAVERLDVRAADENTTRNEIILKEIDRALDDYFARVAAIAKQMGLSFELAAQVEQLHSRCAKLGCKPADVLTKVNDQLEEKMKDAK